MTLKPIDFEPDSPFTPALAERHYAPPAICLREITEPVKARVGNLDLEVRPNPLTVVATTADGKIQTIIFHEEGTMSFRVGGQPILGMGEGGPLTRGNFRTQAIEFDRRGRFHNMQPRCSNTSGPSTAGSGPG